MECETSAQFVELLAMVIVSAILLVIAILALHGFRRVYQNVRER